MHALPPKTWTPQSESQHCTLVPVKTGSSEWAEVESQLVATMPKARLKQLERIQCHNVHLWEYNCFRQALMTNRAGGKDPNVVSVWHGTKVNDPKLIYEDLQDGFMMQHSAAGMWGRGIYFAENASYSNNYAHTIAGSGQRCFLLAKLIVGEAKDLPSDGSLQMPPTKPGGGGRTTPSWGTRAGAESTSSFTRTAGLTRNIW